MTVATDPRKTGIQAGMTLLAASAVAVSVTGTTSETALATTVSSDGFTSSDRYTAVRANVTAISGTGAAVSVAMAF